MKKLLSFFAVMCLVGIVSVKAQSASDSSYARDLSYSTINFSALPDTLYDTLTPTSKLLRDFREGVAVNGYTFTISTPMMMNIKMLSGGWDSYLFLLDSNYHLLAYDDDWGSSDTGSRVIRQLSAGTYHLLACNYSEGRLSSNRPYRIVLDTCSFGDFSSLTFEPKTFGRPFTDTLSNGGQPVQILGGEILYAKGYSMNFPVNSVMLQVDMKERMILFVDSNYNLMNGYGNSRKVIIPVQQAATYRFVVISDNDWELDTTVGKPFTVTSDTINAAIFATLSYRNFNIGDTIVDSINSTDPYLLSGVSNIYYFNKNAKGAKSPNGLTHARGYSFRTSATDNYFQFTAENVEFANSSYFYLLDSNKHVIQSFYNYSFSEKYLSVNPSSTYYIVATSDAAEDTGVYRFYTKADTDIPVYYVDALNGDNDSNGLTPATAKRTLDAVGYATAKARVYLTEDYHITSTVTLGRYFEIYPYGKNIRLYPEITSWSYAIRVNGNMVFGKHSDSLYFVIDSAVCRSVDEFLSVNNGVIEVNNLKVRNSVYDDALFYADSVSMNNCEFVNDSIGYEIVNSSKVRMVNTTVSNNFIHGHLLGGYSLYFENSTVSGNTSTEISIFEMGSAVMKSGSVTNNQLAPSRDYDEILAPLNVRMENMAGIFFLFSEGLTIGPNFSMDTSAYIFIDRNGVINTPEVITVPLAAKVYPIDYTFYSIPPDYYEGRRILAGPANVLAANRTHFAIVQPADQTWYLHNNGCIYTSQQGIAQAERAADVVLYPNPTSDRFVVQLDGTEADEICMFDIYGKQVKRIAASQGANSIGVQNFARGIYFVQVRKNGTVVATRKLIKK